MSQKGDLFHPKVTLFEFGIKLVVSELVQDHSKVFFMFCLVGVLEPILRKDYLIRGSPRLKSRREIDTGIFIQVQAFSGENNNPTPVCV